MYVCIVWYRYSGFPFLIVLIKKKEAKLYWYVSMCRLNDMNRVIEVQTWANKGKMPYTQSYLSGVIVSLNQRCSQASLDCSC